MKKIWKSKPDKAGYWWFGPKPGITGSPRISEVQKNGKNFEFSPGITWVKCNDYPELLWSGPIIPPAPEK